MVLKLKYIGPRQPTFQQIAQMRITGSQYHKRTLPETLHQNLIQIEELIKEPLITIEYTVGQWIDVKDTEGYWLEAQVIEKRPMEIKIHYNSWEDRWDEWLGVESDRIAPFRTYTIQNPNSRFQSPYPGSNAKIDLPKLTMEKLLERYCIYHDNNSGNK